MSIYVLIIVGLHWVFTHTQPRGILLYALAGLPALPIIAVLAILGRYIAEEKDELERAIVVQCSLWATGLMLSYTSFRGFLENYAGVHPMPLYGTFIVWWIAFGLVKPIIWWRYR